jgi:ribosomal protein L37E
MTFQQREAILKKNGIALTDCKCDNCGEKSYLINKEDGFYCCNCGKYPLTIINGNARIVNERSD